MVAINNPTKMPEALRITNLHVSVGGKPILKGLNLELRRGEVHALMGPNGSGKSTLGYAIAGHPGYDVTEGQVLYNGKDLLELDPEERAHEGLFLAFQYPVEIPGVNSTYFLRAALNEVRKSKGLPELDAMTSSRALMPPKVTVRSLTRSRSSRLEPVRGEPTMSASGVTMVPRSPRGSRRPPPSSE